MRNEDHGVEIGQLDGDWDAQDPLWCHATDPTTGWFCSLSPNHTSVNHVACGGTREVLARWCTFDRDLTVASGL